MNSRKESLEKRVTEGRYIELNSLATKKGDNIDLTHFETKGTLNAGGMVLKVGHPDFYKSGDKAGQLKVADYHGKTIASKSLSYYEPVVYFGKNGYEVSLYKNGSRLSDIVTAKGFHPSALRDLPNRLKLAIDYHERTGKTATSKFFGEKAPKRNWVK